jgi:hypothetical protein
MAYEWSNGGMIIDGGKVVVTEGKYVPALIFPPKISYGVPLGSKTDLPW